MAFKEISAKEINTNAITLIGDEWMLIGAKDESKENAMTASWGGLGVMWGKEVAFVVIRPQRYTKKFVDKSDTLSLSFFDESYKKELAYFGKVSGRDEDKIKKSGFTVVEELGVPVFKEAKLTIIGKKLFAQDYKEESFIQKDIIEKWYPQKDFHTLYIVEIQKVLVSD